MESVADEPRHYIMLLIIGVVDINRNYMGQSRTEIGSVRSAAVVDKHDTPGDTRHVTVCAKSDMGAT